MRLLRLVKIVRVSQPIPEPYLDLFQKPAFAHLATIMPNNSPQVTPVWVDYDGEHILVNTALGRVKERNMRLGAKVALAILDPDNPYRYLQIRGSVVERTEVGAREHINALSLRYTGKPFPFREGERRLICKISAEHLDLH